MDEKLWAEIQAALPAYVAKHHPGVGARIAQYISYLVSSSMPCLPRWRGRRA